MDGMRHVDVVVVRDNVIVVRDTQPTESGGNPNVIALARQNRGAIVKTFSPD